MSRTRGPRRRFGRSPSLNIGIVILGIICLIAVFAPIIWGSDADALTTAIRQGPSAQHLLGTDAVGRDILARTLVATRLTVLMAVASTSLSVAAGAVLGAGVVVIGGRVRHLGERLIDLLVAYPPIVIALAITAILKPGKGSLILAIGLAFSPQFARLSNTLAASANNADYVTVARLLGLGRMKVLLRHIVPNIVGPVLVLTSVGFATTIVTLSGLSFIGLGVQAPSSDWGQLLSSGLQSLYTNPISALGPALAILLTGLSAGLIGDGLAQRSEVRVAVVTSPDMRTPRGAYKPGESAGEGLNPVSELGPRRPAPAVSVRNLEVATGSGQSSRSLVRGVSLDIGEAEIVGIVGESGSGKSLTAMAIARLLPGTLAWSADQLTVSGKELRDPKTEPPAELAMDMGIVFQDPSSCFNPALRIGTQLTETVRVHRKMSRREAENLALERLREVQVSAPERRMRQYPFQLSGGLRQRAMIAMSLMTRPKVLIADEPTTALDVTVQADVLHLLKRLNVNHRMAILFISHDVSAVSALCDRVCVMYAGRIVEELSADDLRQRRAQHPYTRALIAASPSSTASRQQPLVALPGRPPGAGEVITGCAFADRCPLVMDVCRTVDTALLKTDAGSAVACHAVNGVAERGEARYVS